MALYKVVFLQFVSLTELTDIRDLKFHMIV